MIEFKVGDILSEDVEALVNTVNCVGVMGRGIALQFKNAFPENFISYAAACKRAEVKPGEMYVFENSQLVNPRYIINFPTKRHWRGKSRMEDIETGLDALVREIRERNIRSIAIPPLGSGLGGLKWGDVRERIGAALSQIGDLRIVVFEPRSRSGHERPNKSRKVPKMTPGRAALVELMRCYLRGLLDPMVTLLELHKLMYFLQEVGEPLRLKYKRAHYGPYAENLRHVLIAIEGHLISGYFDGGDAPDKPIELVPGAVSDADRFLEDKPKTLEHLDRVSDLVDGFESPFGLELLSTVHWLVSKEQASTVDDVTERAYAWSGRKRRFSQRQIKLAYRVLEDKGWIGSRC